MRRQDLIHPMTAGDLVYSACVLAVRERGMGAETETSIWECVGIEQIAKELKAETPLLFTRISL